MKNNYLKSILLFALLVSISIQTQAQVRITNLNPDTNTVILRNFGSSSEPIGGLWFCNFPSYAQVSGMTSTTDLAAGASITISSTINFNAADGEFGLYTNSSFSSPSSMIDYMQWGSAGHQREGVANSAGVWTSGTFISVAPPFEFTGNGNDFGVNFWQTSLGINDVQQNSFSLSPNPVSENLNISFKNNIPEGLIDVYDISGKLIFKTSITNSNSTSINVSNWNQGIYIISINSNENTQTKRFVKQ